MKSVYSAFRSFFKLNPKTGLGLIILFTGIRFLLVLQANVTQNYGYTSVLFMIMWVFPFIFLNKTERHTIGIKKPDHYVWLLFSLILGIGICSLLYFITHFLYTNSIQNSFVYISYSYNIAEGVLTPENRFFYFLIFSIIGMTFSPVGEEFLYRGIIHECFVPRFGETNSSRIDSSAFALAHLSHFGIIYNDGKWSFLLLPATLWCIGMYLSCRLFYICKIKSGSIFGAILAHAGFNIAMMYFIFYYIK